MKRFIIICLAVGLVFIFSAKFTFSFLVPDVEATLIEPLEEVIPAEMEGWHSRKVPLSSTPEGVDRVLAVLDLDDVFSREYIRGDTRVLIYVAYWYPGSEPYSSVAIHNPDSCWVIAGWNIEARESNRKISIAGYPLKEHEWGIYTKKGAKSYVMFWHLLGGVPNKHIKRMLWTSTGIDSIKRQFYFIYNIYQMGLDLGQDQLFVRISANKPFDELEENGDLKQILKHLEGLGLTREGRKTETTVRNLNN